MTSPKSLNQIVSISLLSLLFAIPALAAQEQQDNSEIVRISYLEGDVRVSLGKDGHPDLNSQWFTATRGFNISEGDTLATGNGRAEIEFENGSTVYLADNSVLEFEDLEVPIPPDVSKLAPLLKKRGIDPASFMARLAASRGPKSEIFLLSGSLTLDFIPAPAETFNVASPSGRIDRYSKRIYVRLDSYLDGIEITPLDPDGAIDRNDGAAPIDIKPGETAAYFNDGSHTVGNSSYSSGPFDWNSWVANRILIRNTELKAAMTAAHLDHFVPGLLDLYESGKFFACAPYTCWLPADATAPESDQDNAPASPSAASSVVPVGHVPSAEELASFQQSPSAQDQQTQSASQNQNQPQVQLQRKRYVEYGPNFDCTQTRTEYEIDPITRERRIINQSVVSAPWAGATCYGDYYNYGGEFLFVAGARHHHPPFHPVKFHHHNCYVLRSPSDGRGKPPANLKYGVFSGTPAKGFHLTPVSSRDHITVLAATPKEFSARNLTRGLTSSTEPHIQAHSLFAAESASRGPGAKAIAPAINYDYGRHAFVTQSIGTPTKPSAPVVVGKVDSYGGFDGVRVPLTSQRAGYSGPVYAHVGVGSPATGFHGSSGSHSGNSNGSYSAHNGSSNSSGYHGGSSGGTGGGYHGGGSSGGGGGGSHGGGGGSSGGGASHGGGGGGGSSGGGGGGGGGSHVGGGGSGGGGGSHAGRG